MTHILDRYVGGILPLQRWSRAHQTGEVIEPARHLLRARDLADRCYADDLSVADLAREAALSKAHFSREFADAFGASPHQYLRARRLERAASLLRNTDRSITDICMAVGLSSVGSFVTAFGRSYGTTPAAYRSSFPPARRHIRVPSCVARVYGIPNSTFEEATGRSDP